MFTEGAAAPFKLAFIGSHGVGKTTLAYGLAARLKARDLSLDVLVEVARRCPLPLNEETTLAAQAWILHTQIADELVAGARYPLVICDRSVLDNFVYLLVAHGSHPALEPLVDSWVRTYDLLVHVPVRGHGEPQADGIRSSDPAFQRIIDDRLEREIEHRQLPVLRLDGFERQRWLREVEAVVLERLRPAQLELL